MILDNVVTVSDGRKLGYSEYGDPNGRPVFFFHGQPGNRLFRFPDESLNRTLGVRLISVDRPGYGLSDFQSERKLMDWPQDIIELADALDIDRFGILGFSAGGPYALACAHQSPPRLTNVGIVDSAPPMFLPEISGLAPGIIQLNYWLARLAPSVLKIWFRIYWWFSRRKPDMFIKMSIEQSNPTDREILLHHQIYSMLEQVWKENLRRDCEGYVQDIEILMKDWGFRLSDVKYKISLWQGEADANTPISWAKYMARELPYCKATFFPKEGHFVLFSHWEEIISVLVNK